MEAPMVEGKISMAFQQNEGASEDLKFQLNPPPRWMAPGFQLIPD